jgi:endonuclease-8
MPEGPEIRRAADRVAAAIAGQTTTGVFFAFDELKPFEPILTGRKVVEVATRGKAMLTRFTGGLSVYSHNQLYGRWYVSLTGRMPKTGRQLRFAVRCGKKQAMLYSASEIEVLDHEQEKLHPYLSQLGPDLLSESPTPRELAARLTDPRYRRRQLGALLLDQSFVAGLGNYLRAEILFEARIHPRQRAADCNEEQRLLLGRRLIALTKRAYRTRGVTLAPAHVAKLKAEGVRRSRYRFWVYGRQGAPCRICDRQVSAEVVGGRTCFWCPQCQPARAASSSDGRSSR